MEEKYQLAKLRPTATAGPAAAGGRAGLPRGEILRGGSASACRPTGERGQGQRPWPCTSPASATSRPPEARRTRATPTPSAASRNWPAPELPGSSGPPGRAAAAQRPVPPGGRGAVQAHPPVTRTSRSPRSSTRRPTRAGSAPALLPRANHVLKTTRPELARRQCARPGRRRGRRPEGVGQLPALTLRCGPANHRAEVVRLLGTTDVPGSGPCSPVRCAGAGRARPAPARPEVENGDRHVH